MPTGSAVALTVAVVALGRWAQGKKLDMPTVLALSFIGLMIAVIQEGNAKFGKQFAVLILVGAVAVYGVDIFNKFNAPAKGVGRAGKNERPIV